MKKYFVIGPPGSGKSTIAKAWSGSLRMNYFSSGDFVRNIDNKHVKDALRKGVMAPPHIMDPLLINEIDKATDDLVVDGYPRYWQQLADILSLGDIDIRFIIILCPYEVCDQRLQHRDRSDKGVDDRRRKEYEELTYPVMEWIRRSKYPFIHVLNGGQDSILDILAKLKEEDDKI